MVSIVILSKDRDFSQVIADLAHRELGVDCQIIQGVAEVAQWPDAALAVSDHKVALPIPLVTVGKPPVRMRDVLADIRARLLKLETSEWVKIGKWQFSPRLKQLSLKTKSASLTDKEVQLVSYLLEANESVSKEELLKKVWGFEPNVDTHTLETHIYRLRGKCKELGDEMLIVAMDNGYKLQL